MTDTAPSPKQGLPKITEETENPIGGRGTPRKTPKTSHFIETVDNLLASLRESTQNHGPIYTEKGATPRRSKDKKWYRFNSQRIRRDIARSLGKLFDEALEGSSNKTLDPDERLKAGRLAAYTAQTINSITKTYDEVRIEAALEELEKYVKNHST